MLLASSKTTNLVWWNGIIQSIYMLHYGGLISNQLSWRLSYLNDDTVFSFATLSFQRLGGCQQSFNALVERGHFLGHGSCFW